MARPVRAARERRERRIARRAVGKGWRVWEEMKPEDMEDEVGTMVLSPMKPLEAEEGVEVREDGRAVTVSKWAGGVSGGVVKIGEDLLCVRVRSTTATLVVVAAADDPVSVDVAALVVAAAAFVVIAAAFVIAAASVVAAGSVVAVVSVVACETL